MNLAEIEDFSQETRHFLFTKWKLSMVTTSNADRKFIKREIKTSIMFRSMSKTIVIVLLCDCNMLQCMLLIDYEWPCS